MHKKYHVELTPEQRQALEVLISTGTSPARTQTHARILLKADRAPWDRRGRMTRLRVACDVSCPTVERVGAPL
jgi:hypothetical protein